MGNWDSLSIKDRAELIKIYVDGGVIDLPSIKRHYNSFKGGGSKGVFNKLFSKKSSAPDTSELDKEIMDSIDSSIDMENKRLEYQMKENEARDYFNNTTPVQRYYDRLDKQDSESKDFLSGLYNGRKGMFSDLDMLSGNVEKRIKVKS